MCFFRELRLLPLLVGGLGCFLYSIQPVCAQFFEDSWGVLLFKGQTVQSNLDDIGLINYTDSHDPSKALDLDYPNTDELVYGVEVARRISRKLWWFRYLQPYVTELEAALNINYRESQTKAINEIGPSVIFRWKNFRWDRYVKTTIGFAEGVSYTSKVPDQERTESRTSKHFLNLLTLDITLAAPQLPTAELSFRIHHRSAGYGLYGVNNTSSNILGAGLRYRWGRNL
jgi:hypothetical protein